MNFKLSQISLFFVLILSLTVSNSFSSDNLMKYSKITDVAQDKWELLAKQRIYFGHQSVGANIVEGVQAVLKEYPAIILNVVEGGNKSIFANPVFAHSEIGHNGEPGTKLKEFADIVTGDKSIKIDTALMKFCFVDITAETDISTVFKAYQDMVNAVLKKQPDLTIIHLTVPLCVEQRTWKTRIKLLLGREPWELADNAKRNQYNALVRNAYGKSGNLFDLAMLEATKPDGMQQTFSYNRKQYSSLYPGYSSDGQHLNANGAKLIAEKFLLFLVENLDGNF